MSPINFKRYVEFKPGASHMSYKSYYSNQSGSGVAGFHGQQFQSVQVGSGFGSVLKSIFLPILKYLGPKILSTGADVAKDAISGENIVQSLKRRGKEAAQTIAGDAAERATRFALMGKGKRRRTRRKTTNRKRQAISPKLRGSGKRRRVQRKRNTNSKSKISSIFA